MPGPLADVHVIELAGLGPAPFCGMVLADLGADVIRVDRADEVVGHHTSRTRYDLHNRGKRSIGINLKKAGAAELILDMVGGADALIEGFRPGVTERLGIGPAECLARNTRLVLGRVTGWGQNGPLAASAGHDIDYIALSGALGAVGPSERPIPPLNLVGDFGGGGMLLVIGVLAALLHARATGSGQVVDAAIVDGSALLMTSHHGFMAEGWWAPEREANPLDGAAPYYTTYETLDGEHMAVGAIEPQFYASLLHGLELTEDDAPAQSDRESWPILREILAAKFIEGTRDEWANRFEGTDACVAPVLSMEEAPKHAHNVARGLFSDVEGVLQPGPAPRFSSTVTADPSGPSIPGADTDSILEDLGFGSSQIGMLRSTGVVA